MANSCTITYDNKVFHDPKDYFDYIQNTDTGYIKQMLSKLLDDNIRVDFNKLSELIKSTTGKDVNIQTTSTQITVQDFVNAILNDPKDRIRDTSNFDPNVVDSFKRKLEQEKKTILTDLVLRDKLSTIDKDIVGKCEIITIDQYGRDITLYSFKDNSQPTEGEKLEMAIYVNLLNSHGLARGNISTIIVDASGKENYVDVSAYTRNRNFVPHGDVNIDEDPDVLERATKSLNTIFPKHNIRSNGRAQAAKTWCRIHARQLKKVFDPQTGITKVFIPEASLIYDENVDPGDVIEISIKGAPTNLTENNDFIAEIEKHFIGNNVAGKAYGFIKVAYDNKIGIRNVAISDYLKKRFSKYFIRRNIDGSPEYVWKLISNDNLRQANMFLFQNKITGQVDVVVLTESRVDLKESFGSRNNLLGEYLPNTNDYAFDMDNTYGNIEAIRAMAILNECLKDNSNIQLGELSVLGISPNFNVLGVSHDLNDLERRWDEIIKIVNAETNPNAHKIENNIAKKDIQCIEPDVLLDQLWEEINSNDNLIDLDEFFNSRHYNTNSYGLYDAPTVNDKIHKLYELIGVLTEKLKVAGINPRSQDALITASQSRFGAGPYARMYIAAVKTLLKYTGDAEYDTTELSGLASMFIKPSSLKNRSVRKVVEIVRQTHARGNLEINEIWNNVQSIFEEFNKAKGYGAVRNILISDQYKLYSNLFQKEDGKNTFVFKNPYDNTVDLTDDERVFLKKILYEFYKIRCRLLGQDVEITGPNDPKLSNSQSALPPGYLLVPLMRSSDTTRRNKAMGRFVTGEYLKQKLSGLSHTFKLLFDSDPAKWKEIFSRSSKENLSQIAEQLNVYNPYLSHEDPNNYLTRDNYIDEKGENFFETNVETIFADFMSKTIICECMNQSLIKINGIEVALRTTLMFRGETEQDAKVIDKIINVIDQYVNAAVHRRSKSDKGWESPEKYVRKVRPIISRIFIAGNPAGWVRDTIMGPIAAATFAAVGYHPNITLKDIRFGFQHSWLQKLTNPMSRSFYSEMNKRYQLSKFSVTDLPQNLVTARAGIANIDNLLFITMRAPDFVNRMALLTAVLHNLGAYDAYSLDENHHIVYDWRKDKRFEIYASGDTSNPKYKEQQSAYYSAINQYNKDNGTQLSFDDDLPDALSARQLYSIRTLGERLYGGYDIAAKSLCEHNIIMRCLAYFYSWLNGIVELHFAGSHVSGDMWKTVQECDNNGNLLFIDPDTKEVTTNDTGIRLLKEVPMMNEGVFTTLSNGLREWLYDKRGFKESFYGSSVAKRNVKLFLSELAITLLSGLLHSLWEKPAYEEHTKRLDGRKLFENALIEIMYKGSSHSFDTLGGVFTLFRYLSTGISPLAITYPKDTLVGLYQVITGHKDPYRYAFGQIAITRSINESLLYWERDEFNYSFSKIRAQRLKQEKGQK